MPYRLDMPDLFPTLTPDSSRIKMELTIRLPTLISGGTGKIADGKASKMSAAQIAKLADCGVATVYRITRELA